MHQVIQLQWYPSLDEINVSYVNFKIHAIALAAAFLQLLALFSSSLTPMFQSVKIHSSVEQRTLLPFDGTLLIPSRENKLSSRHRSSSKYIVCVTLYIY